jgi:hypothetical protein
MFILLQYLYRNDAEISFPNSRLDAITIICVDAPANNLDNPNTEKKAAEPAIENDASIIKNKKKRLFRI